MAYQVHENKKEKKKEEERETVYVLCMICVEIAFLPSDSREKTNPLCERKEKLIFCLDSGQIQTNLEVSRKALAGTDLMSSGFSVYGSQNLPLVGKDHVLGRITIILVMKTKNVFLFIFPNGPDPARFCVLLTDVSRE